ncbi:MAG TPA: saccharopine dehydrogenase NADP-binding domain-containing protein [Thermoanaerobaculia bacterium]|nr:saccharopine dehydrogenase NADP-binding domain-containing protein [Thermoanaerobaculia bacterium]
MHRGTETIAVYGATGHTGRFVVEEAERRGLPVVAVGRSAERLAVAFPSVPWRVAAPEDPAELERAFSGCALVVNCAGPFLETAALLTEAALRAGCHYLDVTAEQASAQASFADFDAPARAAGRVVVPGAGFYGGLADLLASAVASPGPIDEIIVAVGLDRWWPTLGTRRTGERNKAPRLVVAEGRLAPLQPAAEVRDWTFSPPIGRQPMLELPFSEIITLHRHLEARAIRSLFSRAALDELRDAATPAPTAVDDRGRSAQRFEMVVEVTQGGKVRTAGARGQDIYAVTAPIVIEAAVRVLAAGDRRGGAMALAEAVSPGELLRALTGSALEVFGEVGQG